jgi:hypothetical protein
MRVLPSRQSLWTRPLFAYHALGAISSRNYVLRSDARILWHGMAATRGRFRGDCTDNRHGANRERPGARAAAGGAPNS